MQGSLNLADIEFNEWNMNAQLHLCLISLKEETIVII